MSHRCDFIGHRFAGCQYIPISIHCLVLLMLTKPSPTPLSLLRPVNSHNTPPPNAPAMKIMRRNGQNGDRSLAGDDTTASSSAPSKPVSEVDGDGGNDEDRGGSSAGATPAKDRSTMTREEREAKYQEARERIFRDFAESKLAESPSGDNDADISRSSSTSGRKKNFRQKTPHDDSFEARSQFNAYYPGMQYTQNTVSMPMHNGTAYGPHPYMVGPGASVPAMNYSQGTATSNVFQNNVSQYPMNTMHLGQNQTWQSPAAPQQSPFQGYAALNQSSPMMGPQAQTGSSPNNYAIPNTVSFASNSPPSWAGQSYQNNYPQPTQRNASMNWPSYPSHPMAANTNPYSYGQVPNQQHYSTPAQNQNTHPMMGNFNRSTFNPQTRSFIPTGNPNTGRYNHKGVGHNANVAYNNNPQVNGQRQQWSGHMENNNQPIAYGAPHPNNRANGNTASTNSMPRVAQPGSNDSIAKWGTPAHLPPKPPPSEVPTEFEAKSRTLPIPANSFPNNNNGASPGGPLVVSGGSNVPKSNLD
jgi:SUZ domain